MTPQQQAQQWLRDNCLILDTETTGLGEDAEIVEIAVIDTTGKILLNTLVRPLSVIPTSAVAIHGITNEMLTDAPSWPEVCSKFYPIISGRKIVIYNSEYDTRLLDQTNDNWCIKTHFSIGRPVFECAMLAYAEFYGQKSERGGYKWQKLTAAAEQQGVIIEGTPHRALSDCLTTLGVIKAMAGENTPNFSARILDELSHAAEVAAWEPRAHDAVVEAKRIIKHQDEIINLLKGGRIGIGQHIAELKESAEKQRQRIEHLEPYKAGVISIINACNETYPNFAPFSEDDVLRIVDLIKVDDLPFGDERGLEELDEARELIEVQNRQLDEWERTFRRQEVLLQQAKEKSQQLEACLGKALAFMKGAAEDTSFINWLEKTADSLTTKERNK